MAKIKIGDIFEIYTPKGKAYLHFIHKDVEIGEIVRVLEGLHSERPNNLDRLASTQERYIISFPINAAVKQKIIESVGFCSASNFCKPKFMRTEYRIRGEFLGWHLVDTETWNRQLVKTLSPEQKKLSPWGIWNYELLVERLVSEWKLDDWC